MKTTKKDFKRFCSEFLRWVELFGLKDYRLLFHHKQLEDSFAEIHRDDPGKIVDIYFSKEIPEISVSGYISPEHHAKHEAIHLLLSRLGYLADRRYLNYADVKEEQERIVRILEKIL